MPIGYIVGKQYKLDYNYDRYAKLPVWSLILRNASLHGFGVDVRYSHLGRNYSAEVNEMSQLKGNWFLFSRALKHESDPMSAMIAALIAAGVTDPFMSALYLEGELEALRIAYGDAVEREKSQEPLVEKALDGLRAALDAIPVVFLQGDEVISTAKIGELRGRPFKSVIPMPDFPDDDWHGDIPLGQAKPIPAAPDEDDDL